MTTEGADERYLFAREADLWQAEAERTRNRRAALQERGSEAAVEQAWYDYCVRRHEAVAFELDKIDNPQKYATPHVAHDSLDDLDRQTD